MSGKKSIALKESLKELDQSIHLIRAPGAVELDPSKIAPKKIKVTIQQTQETAPMEE